MASDYAGYSLTIPAVCSALINKQLLPTESLEAFISELETLYQSEVGKGTLTIQREIPSYPAYQLSPQQKDIQHLTDFLHKRFGRAPELRINQSVSDGNILYNSLGIPTILFGPHGIAFHTENEYVKRSSLTGYMKNSTHTFWRNTRIVPHRDVMKWYAFPNHAQITCKGETTENGKT